MDPLDPGKLLALRVTFIEDRNGRAIVRLPNGSKTTVDYDGLRPIGASAHLVRTRAGMGESVWCAEVDSAPNTHPRPRANSTAGTAGVEREPGPRLHRNCWCVRRRLADGHRVPGARRRLVAPSTLHVCRSAHPLRAGRRDGAAAEVVTLGPSTAVTSRDQLDEGAAISMLRLTRS